MGKGVSTIRFKVDTTLFRFIGDNRMRTTNMNLEQESVKTASYDATDMLSKASLKPLSIL